MNSIKSSMIGLLAGVAIITLGVWGYSIIGGKSTIPTSEGNPQTQMEPIKKQPIPTSAIDRVASRKIKGEFGIVGKGEDAKWGLSKTANFKYTVIVSADSKIISKEVLSGGTIKVTEIRKFDKVQDSIVVTNVDLKLALGTLPIDAFSKAVDFLSAAWVSLTGDVASGAAVITGKNYVNEKLKAINGTSVRKLIGVCGIEPPKDMENAINQLCNAALLKALGGVRSISGKSYKISYYQEKSGQPLYVKFSYENGDPVTDDEEKMVLKRVNTFIDYNLVPNKECVPGDSWDIQARDMQEMFDPYVEGTYIGNIRATRKSNTNDGDWTIHFSPSVINIVSDSGNTTGHLNISKGYANVNPRSVSVNELFVEGKAEVQKLSKHHWLFTARIAGACDFQGRLVTIISK